MKKAGVDAATASGIRFDWDSQVPYEVFVSVRGAEDQIKIIRHYFMHGLMPEHNKHGSFWGKMGPQNKITEGLTAIALHASNYKDLAQAVGVTPPLTAITPDKTAER